MCLSYWTAGNFLLTENIHIWHLHSNFLNPLPIYVCYDSSCTNPAKHTVFPQMILENQQYGRAALTANYQQLESWGENKGMNKVLSCPGFCWDRYFFPGVKDHLLCFDRPAGTWGANVFSFTGMSPVCFICYSNFTIALDLSMWLMDKGECCRTEALHICTVNRDPVVGIHWN